MGGNKTTASKGKDSNHTGLQPTIDKQQLKTETRKRKKRRSASEDPQPKARDMRSHGDKGDSHYTVLDDDDSGDDGDCENNKGFDEAYAHANRKSARDAEDMKDHDGGASERARLRVS
jgi:hypothetical protein